MPEACSDCCGAPVKVAYEKHLVNYTNWFVCTACSKPCDAARAYLAQPELEGLPPGYIDAEHTGQDREMLEVFYKACRSEGGTADEIHLRGFHAILARWGRPAIEPVPVPEANAR